MTERDTTAQAGLSADRLDEIDARHSAATPGPWGVYEFGGGTAIDIAADLTDTGTGYRARREICRLEDEPLDNDPTHREWTAEEDWAQVQADAAFIAHAREDVPALLAEIRRLNAALADQQAETEKLIRWHCEDETAMKQMRGTIERLRGEKRAFGELAARRESELITRRAALEKIRHLHKDSPMGPCPVCIDADAAAAGGDGLVPYPCPTGRLAGAQDCDPPHTPAAVSSVV
ncbi:hypothetical protein IHE56_01000 [Streptomyces sp. ID01-12c]|nr:hypothetical protein [Streptomyces caniscabiei]